MSHSFPHRSLLLPPQEPHTDHPEPVLKEIGRKPSRLTHLEKEYTRTYMSPFPYLPMAAILVSLVSFMVIQMSVFAYAGFMVEYLGIVSHKNEAGET